MPVLPEGVTHIGLHLNGENCWPDLRGRDDVIALESFEIARLPHGTAEGRTSVALRFDLPDGRTVIVQATLRNLLTAVQAIQAMDD